MSEPQIERDGTKTAAIAMCVLSRSLTVAGLPLVAQLPNEGISTKRGIALALALLNWWRAVSFDVVLLCCVHSDHEA